MTIGRRRLARYIARRFVLTIGGTFLLCSLLILLIDLVELLRQSGKGGGLTGTQVAWLSLLRLPAYAEALLPFSVLVGTLSAFLLLSRSSELTVMRGAGMSVWQIVRPGVFVAFLIGVFSVTVFNPMASAARSESERLIAEALGREASILSQSGSGAWLRQEGPDGQSVLNAQAVTAQGTQLSRVVALVYDRNGTFQERVEGAKAQLKDQVWEISDGIVSRVGREPIPFGTYNLSTYLTPERVQDALGSVLAVSVWQLPGLIEVAEKAGLPSFRQRVTFELLLSRPFLLVAMVLLGATVSLRSFRFGRVRTMVLTGVIGGLGFFLFTEISRQLGASGLTPPRIAVWVPVGIACLVSLTVLAHQEDG